ncbi:MAG: dihydrofolate reductase [Oscillospiraceae bacterium]|nr:dihydrofolate reductase [Oscillospiraceae bacterium]
MNLIVAVDQNWAIGKGGDQLTYIKDDLKRFQSLTTGGTIILGRRTLDTFPGGRPLKNRRNLILSRDPDFRAEGAQVYHDLDSLLADAPEDAFVVGGASIYRQLLDCCDTAYVTYILAGYDGADAWFPDLDSRPEWKLAEEEGPFTDEVSYTYRTYKAER